MARKARAPRKNTGADRNRTPWTFGEGKYLSTPSINRSAVSSGASVDTLRGALGLRSGIFDGQVREMVMQAQDAAGLPVTGVVTEEDWDAIVNATLVDHSSDAGKGDEGDEGKESVTPADE